MVSTPLFPRILAVVCSEKFSVSQLKNTFWPDMLKLAI
jgi:hypothetical protein